MALAPGDFQALRPLLGVPAAEIEALLPLGHERDLAEGEVLVRPGTPADRAWLLVDGRLSVSVDDPPRRIGDIWPGEVVGESAFFGEAPPHTVLVTAEASSRVLEITPELLEASRGSIALMRMQGFLVGALSRRIKATNLGMRKAWQEHRAAEATPSTTPEPEVAPTLAQRLGALLGMKL